MSPEKDQKTNQNKSERGDMSIPAYPVWPEPTVSTKKNDEASRIIRMWRAIRSSARLQE